MYRDDNVVDCKVEFIFQIIFSGKLDVLLDLLIDVGQRDLYFKGGIHIENAAFGIGEGACIMPGVTIGANSVIGANRCNEGIYPKLYSI